MKLYFHPTILAKPEKVIAFDGVRKVIEPLPEHLKKPEWLWIRKLRTGRRQWLNRYTCHLITCLLYTSDAADEHIVV